MSSGQYICLNPLKPFYKAVRFIWLLRQAWYVSSLAFYNCCLPIWSGLSLSSRSLCLLCMGAGSWTNMNAYTWITPPKTWSVIITQKIPCFPSQSKTTSMTIGKHGSDFFPLFSILVLPALKLHVHELIKVVILSYRSSFTHNNVFEIHPCCWMY